MVVVTIEVIKNKTPTLHRIFCFILSYFKYKMFLLFDFYKSNLYLYVTNRIRYEQKF